MIALPERGRATRLLLVRHAEPDESLHGRCYGSLDVPLSAAGLRRAAAVGELLRDHDVAAVYTSPLQRAFETARAVATAHGLEPIPRDDLRELDFGEVEGMRFDEIASAHPELYRFWMEDPASVRFPGGEGLADLRSASCRRSPRYGRGTRRRVRPSSPTAASFGSCSPTRSTFPTPRSSGSTSPTVPSAWSTGSTACLVRVAGAVLYSRA